MRFSQRGCRSSLVNARAGASVDDPAAPHLTMRCATAAFVRSIHSFVPFPPSLVSSLALISLPHPFLRRANLHPLNVPGAARVNVRSFRANFDAFADDIAAFAKVPTAFANVPDAFANDIPAFADDIPAFADDIPAFANVPDAFANDIAAIANDFAAFADDIAACADDIAVSRATLQPSQMISVSAAFASVPGAFASVSGAFADVPGSFANDIAAFAGDIAAFADDIAAFTDDVPGVFASVPGAFASIPGAFASIPGAFADVPGAFADVPGAFADVPGAFASVPATPASNPATLANVSLDPHAVTWRAAGRSSLAGPTACHTLHARDKMSTSAPSLSASAFSCFCNVSLSCTSHRSSCLYLGSPLCSPLHAASASAAAAERTSTATGGLRDSPHHDWRTEGLAAVCKVPPLEGEVVVRSATVAATGGGAGGGGSGGGGGCGADGGVGGGGGISVPSLDSNSRTLRHNGRTPDLAAGGLVGLPSCYVGEGSGLGLAHSLTAAAAVVLLASGCGEWWGEQGGGRRLAFQGKACEGKGGEGGWNPQAKASKGQRKPPPLSLACLGLVVSVLFSCLSQAMLWEAQPLSFFLALALRRGFSPPPLALCLASLPSSL
ncbi:unnamed protein product [Closterium sp. Naga37s-1]|nr:unnamed protein product [Closterium sp. Naga37s-1]